MLKTYLETYSIENKYLKASFLNKGCTLISLCKKSDLVNMVVRYQDINSYLNDDAYLGCMIGPLAGRTRMGKYTYDGIDLSLSINNPPNHLHGGIDSLNEVYFDVHRDKSVIQFTKIVNHEKDGYPGEIEYDITYTLRNNELVLDMKASPSVPTPINLTNHSYFRLGSELKEHTLQIDSAEVYTVDATMINSYISEVKNTVFDFREEATLGSKLIQDHPQFKITKHIDHNFIFQKSNEVHLNTASNHLTIRTTLPCVQIYLANYFDSSMILDGGVKGYPHFGVAIEPQYAPGQYGIDGPKIYTKENPYSEQIVYSIE